jgi:hypothetical protein
MNKACIVGLIISAQLSLSTEVVMVKTKALSDEINHERLLNKLKREYKLKPLEIYSGTSTIRYATGRDEKQIFISEQKLDIASKRDEQDYELFINQDLDNKGLRKLKFNYVYRDSGNNQIEDQSLFLMKFTNKF